MKEPKKLYSRVSVAKQMRRALMSKEERAERRKLLSLQTGVARKPKP